ncbi:MAG: ATP-binding protein [Gammaproteobacteria bacterium]|nr:ATP-binding protein [Gammaproteobacteria bacterium]
MRRSGDAAARASTSARWTGWKPSTPDDRQRVQRASFSQADGSYHEQYRIIRPDGTERWIADRAFPIRDRNGDTYRIAGLAEDVTGRVETEHSLRDRIRELDCLYAILQLTTCDDSPAASIYAEVVELLPKALGRGDAAARLLIDGTAYCSTGWCQPAETLTAAVEANDHEFGTIEVGYAALQLTDNERDLCGAIAAHLGRMCYGRLMTETLNQSQRLEAVSQLTGGLAHDFNNLLTVILGNAELLKEQLDAQSRHSQIADAIGAAAQRGADLTHQLLAFSRRQRLEPRALDVNQQLLDLESLLQRTLGEDVDLAFARAGNLWQAQVDPAQLESALLNLVLNARDAMPGGGRLTVETANVHLGRDYVSGRPDLPAGQYVMVAVSDTGQGIAAANLSRVFEPFYTTKASSNGSGLGLSMVHGFIKQSRGHIELYSEPGQGTTVKLYLPRAIEAAPAPAEAPQPAAQGGTESVLLVEDDALVRRYASSQLAELGYRVSTAGSGPEALELLDAQSDVDLLFTDVIMPGGMSGREVAEEARRRRPGLRVLFTSGYAENAIVHHGRLEPGMRLLGKPYHRSELARAVRQALEAAA